MSDLSPELLAAAGVTFFCAGIVKGVSGMGLPTISMAVLGSLMPPVVAAGLLIVPSLVTNVWQLAAGPSVAGVSRRLWTMMAAVVVGTFGGVALLTSGRSGLVTGALGSALIAYAGYGLLARRLRASPRMEAWLSPATGLATGLLTGATGVFVIPAVPYLQALDLEKEDLVQALGLSFTVSSVALAAALAGRGAFHLGDLALSTLAIAPALGGMWVGQVVRKRVSPAAFRRWFLIVLLALGGEMVLRSVV